MWDFSLTDAARAVWRTAPFVLLRLIVYAAAGLAVILMTGFGAGLGHILARLSHGSDGALWGGITGFVLVVGLLRLARAYFLYLIKAGHIAVLVALFEGSPVPGGENQIRYGARFVRSHFAEASILFGVDQIIKAVLRALMNTINRFVLFLPIPGLAPLLRLAEAIVRMSLTYVDELILAHLIRARTENPWQTAKEGLVLYAQNYRLFLKNALWLSLFLWVIAAAMFVALLAPAWAFAAALPGHYGWWGLVFAAIGTWPLRVAILEPLAIAALMQVFFHATDGQRPDPEWEARLNAASARFRELGDKAAGWISRPAAPLSGAMRQEGTS